MDKVEIQQYVQKLPASRQAEVLDFVEYLVAKSEREIVLRRVLGKSANDDG